VACRRRVSLPKYSYSNARLTRRRTVQSIKAMAYDRDSGIPDPDSCRTVFTLAAALAREDEDAGGGERANKHENEHAAHDSRLQAAKRTTIDETDAVVENDAPVAAGTERSCLHEQAPRSLLASGELGGLALDSQGYIWVPLYASGCMPPGSPASARQSSLAPSSWVLRVHGVTGEVERSISLGTWRPTACAFGGDALDDLYITTRYSIDCSLLPDVCRCSPAPRCHES
jgi:hypothetical protein